MRTFCLFVCFNHFIKGNFVSCVVQCCYKSGGVKGSGAVDRGAGGF